MIVHRWGCIGFKEAQQRMYVLHTEAVSTGEDHLILCSHPPVFTVGSDDTGAWGVETQRCGRGGSVTAHSPGQCIFYYLFHVPSPARFYAKVVETFTHFFEDHLPQAAYDRNRPGFYIDNRKIASLGFRYRQGVSLYGVALNVDVDLAFHAQVPPCGLEGVVPTSLSAEGVKLSEAYVNDRICALTREVFDARVEA